DIGTAHAELVDRRRKGMVGGRTGRRGAEDRSLQPELHADLAGRSAGHDTRNGEDAGARLTLEQDGSVIVFDRLPAADAGADDGAHAVSIQRLSRKTRITQRLSRRDHCKQAVAIHRDQPLVINAMIGQRLDFGSDTNLQVVEISGRDFADGGAAATHFVPYGTGISPKGADTAEPGYDDPRAGHVTAWRR